MLLLPLFQVYASVRDEGVPVACVATKNATVNVRVFRNKLAPQFSNDGRYRQTISEDAAVPSRVTAVQASDRDERVRRCVDVSRCKSLLNSRQLAQ